MFTSLFIPFNLFITFVFRIDSWKSKINNKLKKVLGFGKRKAELLKIEN